MNKLNIKVKHLFHSGFTIETENFYLIFDYYKGDISFKNKKTIVFVSHGHDDHFNPIILDWQKDNKNISYVFSSDIEVSQKNIHKVSPYNQLNIHELKISTFGSTDQGVSFLVKVDDITIFHAGDLNWWYWDEDSDQEKIRMEKAFKKEISDIKKESIDLAMFPVDPRLEDYFYYGGKYFIEEVQPKYFIPMHFGDNFYIAKEFIHKIKNSMNNIIELTTRNQKISL